MSEVKVENNLYKILSRVSVAAKDSFDTVATDIQRTSSGASPKLTGVLENNYLSMTYGTKIWEGHIWFTAEENGKDYTVWTHEERYKLGEISKQKPNAHSKFAGTQSVGRKYLGRVVEDGRENYIKHVEDSIHEAIG